jgi:hypothetical protein
VARLVSQLSFVKRLFVVAVVAALIAQILGLLLWAGHARQWLPLHVVAGATLVLGLWAASYRALSAGVAKSRVIFSVLWGLLVIALGYWQADLLIGERHRLIRILHLAAGAAALAQMRYLVNRIEPTAIDRTI